MVLVLASGLAGGGDVALAMVLMAGAGLLLRSYAAVQRVDPGFSRTAVTMQVYLDERYDTPESQRQFFGTLLDRVRHFSGIEAVGMVDALPLSHTRRASFARCFTTVPGYTIGMKTAVSLPDVVYRHAERHAKRTRKSRSQLYAEALSEYLARHAPDDVTEAMNSVVDGLAQTDDQRLTATATRRVLASVEW